MQPNSDNSKHIKRTQKEDSTENEVKIKEEIESTDTNLNEEKEMKWINNTKDIDYIIYENFKLKNEEIELKLECDAEDAVVTLGNDKVVSSKEVLCVDAYMNSAVKEEDQEINNLEVKQYNCLECEVDSLTNEIKKCDRHRCGGSNELTYHLKTNIEDEDCKCNIGTKNFIIKLNVNDHNAASKKLKCDNSNRETVKKCKNIDTRKLYNCDHCDYQTVVKGQLLLHKLKHGIKDSSQNCNVVTFYKNNLTSRVKTHNKSKNFMCTFCSKGFIRQSCFKNHLLKFHNSRDITKRLQEPLKSHKCSYCSKGFVKKENLDHHLFRIHKYRNVSRKVYSCEQCSYETVLKQLWLFHKLKHGVIDSSQILKCYHCNFETFYKSNLHSHMQTHNKIKNFICAFCSKGFTRKSSFNNHLSKFHDSKKLYERVKTHKEKCSYCSKGFADKRHLDNHLFRIHRYRDVKKKLYSCDRCSYETVIKQLFKCHKLKHGVTDTLQIFKCYQCSFETVYKGSLLNHMKKHKSIKDFKCTYCTKEFTQKFVLDNHLLKIHKSKDNITAKIHVCDQCSFECISKNELLTHKLKHGLTDGLQILNCSQCSYETYNKLLLVQHIKKHTNIKEFKCTQCSNEYTRKDYLKKHLLKIHKCKSVTPKR